jgi:hypothetical protein
MSSIHVNLGRGKHVAISIPPISLFGEQVFQERFCTIREISKAWQLSEDAVRRLFRNEPGVLVFESRDGISPEPIVFFAHRFISV